MGHFRYGPLPSQIGKCKYGNIGSIEERLSYRGDRNREHLADIANLAMIEFAAHPDYIPPTPASAPREKDGAAIPLQGPCKSVAGTIFFNPEA